MRRNGTLQLELECGQRISDGLIAGAADGEIARAELDRWLGYSSKLASRWDAGDCDLFTVLPTAAWASARTKRHRLHLPLSGYATLLPTRPAHGRRPVRFSDAVQ